MARIFEKGSEATQISSQKLLCLVSLLARPQYKIYPAKSVFGFPARNFSANISRKISETFYIRKDRHCGVSMATKDNGSVNHERSAISATASAPLVQTHSHCEGHNKSAQCGYYPLIQIPFAQTARLVGKVDVVRLHYPPGDSPGLRFNITSEFSKYPKRV